MHHGLATFRANSQNTRKEPELSVTGRDRGSSIKRKAIHIEDNTIGENKDTHYRIKKRNGNDTAKGIQRTLRRRKNKNKKKHGKTSNNDNQ